MVFGRHCHTGRFMPIRSGTCYWESGGNNGRDDRVVAEQGTCA